MGTWGHNVFENDAAAEFLDTLQSAPARTLTKTLRKIAGLKVGTYIEVDDGSAGWAACELVALAFGRGDTAELADNILDIVAKLRPKEDDRLLALEVLPRISDREHSELADLWREGGGQEFDAAIDVLDSRLKDAANGPRELPKAKAGDVIVLKARPQSSGLVVMQVVGSGEVAVFEGECPDEVTAIEWIGLRAARRVPTSTNKLLRRGRLLKNVPVRKDLKGKKIYASETAEIGEYFLCTAAGGNCKLTTYDEARHHDADHHHNEEDIRSVALSTEPVRRVRSPDELEAELVARDGKRWAERRRVSGPGPFGDIESLRSLLRWIHDYGIEHAINRFAAEGRQWSGSAEYDQRDNYAFVGLVALWRGTWSPAMWPPELNGLLPPMPSKELLARAISAARVLAGRIIRRNMELRMIWDAGPDKGAELRKIVASLQEALA